MYNPIESLILFYKPNNNNIEVKLRAADVEGTLLGLIAFPVAAWFMLQWLKLFTFSTGLTATPFVLSALTVLGITLLTVIFHSVRAAVANPVKGLRSE